MANSPVSARQRDIRDRPSGFFDFGQEQSSIFNAGWILCWIFKSIREVPMGKSAKRATSANAVMNSVADAVRRWKEVAASARELADFSQTMATITEDLRLTPTELRTLVAKGADAAKELPCLLDALQISLQKIKEIDPMVLRDLQRVCTLCDHKHPCDRDIAAGTLAKNYDNYCPNAYTVKALKRDPKFIA
jgi:hypothetical protein